MIDDIWGEELDERIEIARGNGLVGTAHLRFVLFGGPGFLLDVNRGVDWESQFTSAGQASTTGPLCLLPRVVE